MKFGTIENGLEETDK